MDTPKANADIFIVIPAYNEAERIGRVIRGLFEHGWKKIIVVDDGSSDATMMVAREAGALVIRHGSNRGQGASLQTGTELARNLGADVIIHFDGDGQFNASDIAGAVAKLKTEQLDVVLGSRFLDGRSRIPWLKRTILLPVARWINYALTGLKLSDVHNGFRVLSRRASTRICINQDRMAHNTEIPAQIKKYHLAWAEYPVEVIYFEPGQGVAGGLTILWDLFLGTFR